MNVKEVMAELRGMGSEQTKKTLMTHGAPEPFYGVKISDMKTIVKKVKKNHELSLSLYETGNSDAQYLAGLLADEKKISKSDLKHWVEKATWYMLSEYTVPWIAAESKYGFELGKEWIMSKEEKIASAGWACLSSLVALKEDSELDISFFDKCLDTIALIIHNQSNRVKYCMNGFIIAVGSSIAGLTEKAKQTADKIGQVKVEMGETACRVPDAKSYIEKIEGLGKIGKKKKMARC